jgi:hypothetical protein
MRQAAGVFSVVRSAVLAGLVFSPAGAGAMEFSTVPIDQACSELSCRRAVIAEGEITSEAPAQFSQFLRRQLQVPGLHAVVFLNSPGGNVESALQLGSLLHDAGAAVVVGKPVILGPQAARRKRSAMGSIGVMPGHCASACVYSLMGARKRVVPAGARLGVHRMSARTWMIDPSGGGAKGGRVFAGDREINALRSYVARVGGSQELISLAESIPADQIRMLSGAEVRRYRLGSPSL